MPMRVLLITEHDDGVGPMTAAFLRDYSMQLEVMSVGRMPAKNLHQMVVAAMRECLVDLTGYQPKGLMDVDKKQFDMVVEWPEFPLPSDMDSFRVVRDEVKNEAFKWYKCNCLNNK